MSKIEVVTLAENGDETDRRDFDFVKDARWWVTNCGLSEEFWDRRAESPGFACRNVHTLRLLKDGECVQDWWPEWFSTDNLKAIIRDIRVQIGSGMSDMAFRRHVRDVINSANFPAL